MGCFCLRPPADKLDGDRLLIKQSINSTIMKRYEKQQKKSGFFKSICCPVDEEATVDKNKLEMIHLKDNMRVIIKCIPKAIMRTNFGMSDQSRLVFRKNNKPQFSGISVQNENASSIIVPPIDKIDQKEILVNLQQNDGQFKMKRDISFYRSLDSFNQSIKKLPGKIQQYSIYLQFDDQVQMAKNDIIYESLKQMLGLCSQKNPKMFSIIIQLNIQQQANEAVKICKQIKSEMLQFTQQRKESKKTNVDVCTQMSQD